MGYKSPAIHPKNYSTDCICKSRYFSSFSDAVKHCLNCPLAETVYYNSAYGEPRVVYKKGGEQC